MINLDNINAFLTEHLDSFVLVGYTMEGERVRLRNWGTAQQEDALHQQLKDEIKEADEGEMLWVGDIEDED